MHSFTQSTRYAQARPSPQTRRSGSAVNVIEYGLLAMLLIILVSIAALLLGSRFNGAFGAVAGAVEKAGKPQSIVSFGQITNRKGAPSEREVSGKFSAIEPFTLDQELPPAPREP